MARVNFNLPLSTKQKEAAVNQALLKEYGNHWYELPLEERQNLREARYAAMWLGKSEQPSPEKVAAMHGSIDSLSTRPTDHVAERSATSISDIIDWTTIIPVGITVPILTDTETAPAIKNTAPEALAPAVYDIVPAKIAGPDEYESAEDVREARVSEYIPAGDDNQRFAKAKDIKDVEKAVKETFDINITLNDKQILAADYAIAGKCFCLTGAAGTGKTTGTREIAKRLMLSGKLRTHVFKLGGARWTGPSFAAVAYTNRASNNMRKAMHKDPFLEENMRGNVLTVHKLLEFEPEYFLREDGSTGMRFIPKRHRLNKLTITHLIIEEASMLGIDLWMQLYEALEPGVQIIFIGDINQLPPVFTKSILNYALVTLPVVELTEVYRQALDNPIIANAHRCLRGENMETVKPHFIIAGGPKGPGAKMPSESSCVNILVGNLKKWNEELIEGTQELKYDPAQDIVLCPFGKENKERMSMANTTVLNNHIAQFLGAKRGAVVYEIIAGMNKLYLAEGDRVMIDKQDGFITRIAHNGQYLGKMPKPASSELTRFGVRLINSSAAKIEEDFELEVEGYENLDVSKVIEDKEEEPKRAASHIVDVLLDSGRTVSLSSAADFHPNWFSLGYALTVHKAQGCEWRKVIILLHRSHATMLNRELVYTAITRAREYCIVVDLCNQINKAIETQRIKGNSVAEKIEWFNSEVNLTEPVPVIP